MVNSCSLSLSFVSAVTDIFLFLLSTRCLFRPTYFQTFVNYFEFVNLSFIPWSSVECVASLTFFDKLVLVTAVPLAAVLFVALIPTLILVIRDRLDMDDSAEHRTSRRLSRQKIVKLVVFALFLMYPAISSRVLSFFICREINGTNYLVADFTQVCGSDEWFKYLPLAVIALIVYVSKFFKHISHLCLISGF